MLLAGPATAMKRLSRTSCSRAIEDAQQLGQKRVFVGEALAYRAGELQQPDVDRTGHRRARDGRLAPVAEFVEDFSRSWVAGSSARWSDVSKAASIRPRMSTAAYVRLPDVRGAHEVAHGVWLLGGRPKDKFNVYVMGDVLVDSATRHATRRILRQVTGLPLRSHVLTHGHMDHMGAAHEICEALNLPLICGEKDVAAVESGARAGLPSRPLSMRIEHRLIAGPGHPVSETLKGGDSLAGFSVLEVPGHAPGHLAFWREEDRVLVLGDVVFGLRVPFGQPGLQLPPAAFTPDPHRNLESARRLAALEPEVICFGHGPSCHDGERFQEFVAGASIS